MDNIYWNASPEEKDYILKSNASYRNLIDTGEYLPDEEKELKDVNADWPDINVTVTLYRKKGYFELTLYKFYRDTLLIGEVLRNYGAYPQYWFTHSNGKRYFICGFDYQGYTIVNIDDGVANHWLDPGALNHGCGWCPTSWESYDELANTIVAEGCYWACPYDHRVYDIENPDRLPLPLISDTECDPEEDDDDETSEDT
jgi:hypothetical protein